MSKDFLASKDVQLIFVIVFSLSQQNNFCKELGFDKTQLESSHNQATVHHSPIICPSLLPFQLLIVQLLGPP